MATLPSLRPNGFVSNVNVTVVGAATAWEAIDDDPDSPTTADYCYDAGAANGDLVVNLTDMPANFQAMQSPLTVRALTQAVSFVDDSDALQVRITDSAGTALTNTVTLSTQAHTTQAIRSASLTVNSTGLAASKATWDGARLHMSWAYSSNMAKDNGQIRVFALEVNGNYTAAPITVNESSHPSKSDIAAVKVPFSLFNDFDGGTAGQNVHGSNSGGMSGTAFDLPASPGYSSITYSSTSFLGSLSARFLSLSTGHNLSYSNNSRGIHSVNQAVYARFYLRVDTLPASSKASFYSLSAPIGQNPDKGILTVNSSGNIQIWGQGNSVSPEWTSTFTVTTGQWIRIEVANFNNHVDDFSGLYELRIYSDPYSPTASDSYSLPFGYTQIEHHKWGYIPIGTQAAADYLIDGIALSNVGWVGPDSYPIAPNDATHAHAADNGSVYITGSVVASFAQPVLGKTFFGLAHDGTDLWACDSVDDMIYRLDQDTGAVLQSFSAPSGTLYGLTFDGTDLWLAGASPATIWRLSTADGTVLQSFSSPYGSNTRGLTYDGEFLYVGHVTGAYQGLDPSDGSTISSHNRSSIAGGSWFGMAHDGAQLWSVYSNNDQIHRIDPATDTSFESFSTPATNPVGLTRHGRYLWHSDNSTDQIYKILAPSAPSTSHVTQESSHQHSSGNATVTIVPDSVTPHEATHAHSVDSTTLTEKYVSDWSQPTSATTANVGNVTPQQSMHAHAADEVSISQVHSLSVADGVHGHGADAPSLFVIYDITVDESSSAHSSGSVNISVTYNVAVSETSSVTSADNVVVLVPIPITVTDETVQGGFYKPQVRIEFNNIATNEYDFYQNGAFVTTLFTLGGPGDAQGIIRSWGNNHIWSGISYNFEVRARYAGNVGPSSTPTAITPATEPAIEFLSDTFGGAIGDNWSYNRASIDAGKLQVPILDGSFAQHKGTFRFDIGSSVHAEIDISGWTTPVGGNDTVSFEVRNRNVSGSGNQVEFRLTKSTSGSVTYNLWRNGSQVGSTQTYNSTTMRWIRFVKSSTTSFMVQYSANGLSWTSQSSIPSLSGELTRNYTVRFHRTASTSTANRYVLFDNLNLRVFAPVESLHASSSDNAALAQNHVISANAASHNHSADNVAISSTYAFSVNAADHAHESDQVALTQTHALLVDESGHTQAADSSVVTQFQYSEFFAASVSSNSGWGGATNALGDTPTSQASFNVSSSNAGLTSNQETGNLTLAFDFPTDSLNDIKEIDAHVEFSSGDVNNSGDIDMWYEVSVDGGSSWTTVRRETAEHGYTIYSVDITGVTPSTLPESQLLIRGRGTLTSGTGLGSNVNQNWRRAWISAVHSVPGTLSINGSGHGHSADESSLSQTHQLTPAEAAHGHVADEATVSQAHQISVNESAHELPTKSSYYDEYQDNYDEVDLDQTHILVVAESSSGSSSDDATIVGQSMGVHSATHAHFSEESWISQTQEFPPTSHTWVVPSDVTTVHLDLSAGPGASPQGHNGARIQGDLTVTPGETLWIFVGRQGEENSGATGGAGGATGDSNTRGMAGGNRTGVSGNGGDGGGGATSVCQGGSAKANTVLLAGARGGDAGDGTDAAGISPIVDTEADTPNSATTGTNALLNGGGGGGGGWRGGTGGAGGTDPGNPGTSMAHSTAVTNVVHDRFGGPQKPNDGVAFITWSVLPSGQVQLSPSQASHDHSADVVSVTQTHAISSESATHGHVADEATVSEAANLVTDDADHAHVADLSSISQVHVVSVGEAQHQHASESASLSQIHVLAVSPGTHDQVSDFVEISQGHVLAVGEAAHAVSSDEVDLDEHQQIAVDPATHAHSVDGVTLSQSHLLAPDETTHDHLAGDVTVQPVISVGSADHETSSTTPHITRLVIPPQVVGGSFANGNPGALTQDNVGATYSDNSGSGSGLLTLRYATTGPMQSVSGATLFVRQIIDTVAAVGTANFFVAFRKTGNDPSLFTIESWQQNDRDDGTTWVNTNYDLFNFGGQNYTTEDWKDVESYFSASNSGLVASDVEWQVDYAQLTLFFAPPGEIVPSPAGHDHAAESPAITQLHALSPQGATHDHSADNVNAAITIDVVPQESTHAHSIDSVGITQQHQVLVAESSHTHNADAAEISQGHALAIAEARSLHVADEPVVSQVHDIALSDAHHAHATDNVDLGQQHQIAVEALLHGHTADASTITQVHVLASQDAMHGHVADEPAITVIVHLVPDSASHAHAVDAAAITQQHQVAVADAVHAMSSDSPNIGETGTVLPNETFHAHAVDAITLTQIHALSAQDAYHTHSSETSDLDVIFHVSVEDSLHEHASESAAITQQHQIAVDAALHATTNDTVDLDQTHVIGAAEANHAHAADNVELDQHHYLLPDETFHGHIADEAGLDQDQQFPVSSSSHDHLADSPTITQVHALQVEGGHHANSIDSPLVTQSHALAVDATVHATRADNATIVQTGTLLVQRGRHLHSADESTLVQQHQLVAQDSSHQQDVDDVVLTHNVALSVDDGYHGHVADEPTLSISSLSLDPADTLHGHAAESTTVSVTVFVGVDESSHTHTADGAVLSQVHAMAVLESTHSHTVDNATITEVANLAPASTSHASTADAVALTQVHLVDVSENFLAVASDTATITTTTIFVDESTHAHVSGICVIPDENLDVVIGTVVIDVVIHSIAVDVVLDDGQTDIVVGETLVDSVAE